MARKSKKVDVEQLSDDKIEELQKAFGDEIIKLAEDAAKKANKKLEKYGIKVKMKLIVDTSKNLDPQH